jgi:hypothetical protein
MDEQPVPTPAHPESAAQGAEVTLRREDLAALVTSYRRATQSPRQWAWVGFGIGGLTLSAVLITVGEHQQWPDWLAPIFLGAGWVALLSAWAVVSRRARRARAAFQLPCPACGAPLLDHTLGRTGVSTAELAIATGSCPRCGAQILAP